MFHDSLRMKQDASTLVRENEAGRALECAHPRAEGFVHVV